MSDRVEPGGAWMVRTLVPRRQREVKLTTAGVPGAAIKSATSAPVSVARTCAPGKATRTSNRNVIASRRLIPKRTRVVAPPVPTKLDWPLLLRRRAGRWRGRGLSRNDDRHRRTRPRGRIEDSAVPSLARYLSLRRFASAVVEVTAAADRPSGLRPPFVFDVLARRRTAHQAAADRREDKTHRIDGSWGRSQNAMRAPQVR